MCLPQLLIPWTSTCSTISSCRYVHHTPSWPWRGENWVIAMSCRDSGAAQRSQTSDVHALHYIEAAQAESGDVLRSRCGLPLHQAPPPIQANPLFHANPSHEGIACRTAGELAPCLATNTHPDGCCTLSSFTLSATSAELSSGPTRLAESLSAAQRTRPWTQQTRRQPQTYNASSHLFLGTRGIPSTAVPRLVHLLI